MKMNTKRGKLILISASSVVFALLGIEIVLHSFSPQVKIAVNMVYDDQLGHRGVTNEIVTTNTYEYYNQAGFREKTLLNFPYNSLKAPNRPRVAVIGDSITQAFGIEKELRFTEVLQRELHRSFPFDSEVFNFGTPDYGTLEEYFVYTRFVKLLHPDLVILQFLGLNDFLNNGIAFAGKNQSHTDAWRPYAVPNSESLALKTEEQFELPVASAFPTRKLLRDYSYLFRIIEGINIARKQNQSWSSNPGCNEALGLFMRTNNPGWETTQQSTLVIAKKFAEAVVKSGESKFIAVYFPSNVEVVDDMWTNGIEPLLRRCYPNVPFDRWEGEQKFLSLFNKAGIETISLRQEFMNQKGDRTRFFVNDGHLSVQGHELVGKALEKYLRAKHSSIFRGQPLGNH